MKWQQTLTITNIFCYANALFFMPTRKGCL
jgi:hypothetical protein